MGRHFYSVEYLDEDGDPVIVHRVMSEAEAEELIGEFAARGITAAINRLSGHDSGTVSSSDVEKLLEMGGSDQGLLR